jgi:hypothetical protein
MGELHADAAAVRAAAHLARSTADFLTEIDCHTWHPSGLTGSSTSGVGAPRLALDRLAGIAAGLRAWAAAAQSSVAELELAEARSVDRLPRP